MPRKRSEQAAADHKSLKYPRVTSAWTPRANRPGNVIPTTLCQRVGWIFEEFGDPLSEVFIACQKIDDDLSEQPLPEQIAFLRNEIANRIEVIKEAPGHYPEVVRMRLFLLEDILQDRQRQLEVEKEKRLSYETLGLSQNTLETKDQFDLIKGERLLASICTLFRDATPEIQRKVWSKLSDFTRNQWSMFLIEASPKKKDYASKAEAVHAIIKPKASIIEEISGLTNMRGVVIVEGSKRYAKDIKKVNEIIKLLNADLVIRKSA